VCRSPAEPSDASRIGHTRCGNDCGLPRSARSNRRAPMAQLGRVRRVEAAELSVLGFRRMAAEHELESVQHAVPARGDLRPRCARSTRLLGLPAEGRSQGVCGTRSGAGSSPRRAGSTRRVSLFRRLTALFQFSRAQRKIPSASSGASENAFVGCSTLSELQISVTPASFSMLSASPTNSA